MGPIDKAFKAVKREDFLPEDLKPQAGVDAPIPIGFGQTNSQPTTVRLMLEWLDARPGDKVLDVGSGSGWTTALLSGIVGREGRVFAVEVIPELVEFGRHNCRQAGVINASFHAAGKTLGLPRHAPYDRILVSASARNLPKELIDQLKVGGTMVIPVLYSILVVEKTGTDAYEIAEKPGFAFVPIT